MSDIKESVHDLLIVLLSIAVLMVGIYFQQSRQWGQALKSRDQKIDSLDQKNAAYEKELARARDTIAGHESSSKTAAEELQSARQIIGEMESHRQKLEKQTAALQSALQDKDNEIARLGEELSEIKASTGREMAAVQERMTELENTVADQTRQLAEARKNIQRLEASEQQLQQKLQAADTAYTDLKNDHQRLLDQQTAPVKEN
jgi:chromosome segregation ATPase